MTKDDVTVGDAQRVKIDSGVKRIESEAFRGEGMLYEVDFSEATSLEEIGEWAFQNCKSLLEVELPSSLNKIEDKAFAACKKLVSVKNLEAVKVMGDDVFRGCKALPGVDTAEVFLYKEGMTDGDVPENVKRVKIDSDVKRIEKAALFERKDLYEVDFSDATSLEEIGGWAFFLCTSLLEVDLPSSVNRIEDDAFGKCEKLTSVKGMGGVKVMGKQVFYFCKALLEVELLSPLLSVIPSETFSGCESLTKVKMTEGLEFIGVRAFYQCKSLSEVEIPSNVERIEKEAFKECVQLMSVKAKEESQLKVVGKWAFFCCQALLEVDIPPSVEKIEAGAFAGCEKIEMEDHGPVFLYKTGMTNEDVPENVMRVKIDSNVKRIENGAFNEQEELYEVDFSEATSLEEIGEVAFNYCTSLYEVDIPSSVNKIEDEAFCYGEKLKSVKGMEGVKVMGEQVFSCCKALLEIELSPLLSEIPLRTFSGCESLTKVKMTEGLKVIGEAAFDDCSSLLEVEIPSTVELIEERAFQRCQKLTSVKGMEGVKVMGNRAFAYCEKLVSVKNLDEVKVMGDNVFFGVKALLGVDGVDVFLYKKGMIKYDVPPNVERVKIDSDVERIEDGAFARQTELYEVDFSEATSLKEIGEDTFYQCTSLLEVGIPSSVNKIEQHAFRECEKMRGVDFGEATSLEVIGQGAFYGCKSLLEVGIPSSVNQIEKYAFTQCEKMRGVDFSEATSLNEIGEEAFLDCIALSEVEIPSSVNKIEYLTFGGCENLTNVKMVEGLEVIGKCAFYECKSLLEVDVPSSVNEIEDTAFAACEKLVSVKNLDVVKALGNNLFYDCKALLGVDCDIFLYKEGMTNEDVTVGDVQRIKIDSGVKRIEDGAFQEEDMLYEVDFSEATSLEEIGEEAFQNCKSLLEMELPSSVNKIEDKAFAACEKLANVRNLDAVKVMGVNVFCGCKALLGVDTVEVFLYKDGMTNEDVPENVKRAKIDSDVKRIEDGAFKGEGMLYEVDFSEATSLKEIKRLVFHRCNSLSEVEIPSSVKTIEEGAFADCENLTNVKMVEGLKVIGEKAFRKCKSLSEVEIPLTVERIEKEAFQSCDNLAKVKMMEGLKFIGEEAFYITKSLSEVDVPSSVTFVAKDAFKFGDKCITSKLGNNLALGIRLRAIYPKKTQETIPLEKLVTMYSHKPIKIQELQDPNDQDELALLETIKNEYIKFITSLNVSTKNPLLLFQEQNGWVQFVTNYEDYVNKEEPKLLIDFLNEANKKTVQALADAKDRYGRLASKTAVSSIREVFRERLLFQGRYDIAPGAPIHKSATCIVVKAEDFGMKKYYEGIFGRFMQKGLDLKHFGAALKLMHVVSDEESSLVQQQINEYFERVDIDGSKLVSEEEFVMFCLAQFGNDVVLKFMKNKDQFERELEGRKTATSDDEDDDRKKDDLLAKYVVSVIGSYDEKNIDTATLQDAVRPYLSKEEEPEKYCHVLVMPYGDRNLDTIFRSERPELTKVRDMLNDVGNALLHLHEQRNLVHGDLKMLNVVRVQERLLLIDLDASAKIGSDYAGAKFSSGVLPPEMIHCLKDASEKKELKRYYKEENENDRAKRAPKYSTLPPKGYIVKSYLNDEHGKAKTDGLCYELEKADPSLDVWSFGVLLYAMCTGEQSLFSVSRDDDIVDGDSLRKLFDWGADSLLSDRNLEQNVSDPYARDLLLKILTKDPKKRPTMRQVLDHAFFKTEKQTNVEVENLQKVAKDLLVTAKENQKIMKREFAKIHKTLKMVILKQLAMQNMLKYILKGGKFPKYLIILPTKESKKGLVSWVSEKASLKSWMCKKTKARICFVCPISLQPVIGSDGEAIGYDIDLPKDWVKKYGPAILIGLKMLQVGFAVGRGFGLPFPSIGDANEKVAETLGEASDLLSNMQDIAMEELGLEEDDDLVNLLVDKLSDTTEEVMASGKKISDDGGKKIQESYEGVGKLVKDEKFENCGLVQAFCEEDGTTEFVHPDLKALYEGKGQAVLETMGPEMIDNAAAAARADTRNSNKSEGDSTVQTADANVASEAAPPAGAPNPTEPINNIASLLDEKFSQMSQQIRDEMNQSLSILDGIATDVPGEARTSGLQNPVEPTSNDDGFLSKNFSKISKQIQEVQQSMSIRDTIQLSETIRSGSSIVHEGRFRIQSQRFPHRWQERQVFFYHGGQIKHFPASGQWLNPSSSRWQAKKAEDGDGVELVYGEKVCTLRLSGSAKDGVKPPHQQVDAWVEMLNSPSTVKQQRDTSGDHATIKMVDSTGQVSIIGT